MTGPLPPQIPYTPRGKVKDQGQIAYMARVQAQLLEDLMYPEARDGSTIVAPWINAPLSYHLVRCGWRKPNNLDGFPLVEEFDDPVIKKRRVLGPGVYEDAVVWVGADEPDDPLDHLEDMSMRDIENLPDEVKYEAKRRLGLLPPVPPRKPADQLELSDASSWQVTPTVTITDAPEEGTSREEN